jgi:lipoyl synthase
MATRSRSDPGGIADVLTVLGPDVQPQKARKPSWFQASCKVQGRGPEVARRGSTFERSCRVLRNAKEIGGDEVTAKSGLMVGLGETHDEMVDTLARLREHDALCSRFGQQVPQQESGVGPVARAAGIRAVAG